MYGISSKIGVYKYKEGLREMGKNIEWVQLPCKCVARTVCNTATLAYNVQEFKGY